MIGKFIERENRIFVKLKDFQEKKLNFILVGGYAVSAFNHRFSVDADIVIKKEELDGFIKSLKKDTYEEVQRKKLESVYGGEFISFKLDERLPVNFDILVDSLECRQTGASWSFDYLEDHSINKEVEGSEKSIDCKIPEKELLIAIKVHSGRLTDVRDVVALATDIDSEKIKKHADRGREKDFVNILNGIEKVLGRDGFENSFKGVFSEKLLPEGNVNEVKEIVKELKSDHE